MTIVYMLASIGGMVVFCFLLILIGQLIKFLYNLFISIFILSPRRKREREDWLEEKRTGERVYRINGKRVYQWQYDNHMSKDK